MTEPSFLDFLACVWRIADFRHKSAIRRTQELPKSTHFTKGHVSIEPLQNAHADVFLFMLVLVFASLIVGAERFPT